jgi:hypothetical protein
MIRPLVEFFMWAPWLAPPSVAILVLLPVACWKELHR